MAGTSPAKLARAGVHLAISGRNRSALDDLAGDLGSLGLVVRPYPADLGHRGAAEDLATTVEETLGPVDVLVNNAGVEVASSFTRYSPDELDATLALDLGARCC